MHGDESQLRVRYHISTYYSGPTTVSVRALAQIPWVSGKLMELPGAALSLRRLLHAFDYHVPNFPGGGPEAHGSDVPDPGFPDPDSPFPLPPHQCESFTLPRKGSRIV